MFSSISLKFLKIRRNKFVTEFSFNPFLAIVPILHHLETPSVFSGVQGVQNGKTGLQWVNKVTGQGFLDKFGTYHRGGV